MINRRAFLTGVSAAALAPALPAKEWVPFHTEFIKPSDWFFDCGGVNQTNASIWRISWDNWRYAARICNIEPENVTMTDTCLCPDFELRGQVYEIWSDSMSPSNRCLVDPRKSEVIDTDHDFEPPLSNDELLAIYDYGKGY